MSTLKDYTNAIEQPQVGEIIPFIGTYPLEGYLLCDGSIVSQSTYPELYSKIGLIPDGFNNVTARTSGNTTQAILALTYGNGLYLYAGASGILGTSTDAITWTVRTSGTTSSINTVVYGNGLYVYAGAGGVLATSTDAITWTARTSGTTSAIFALVYNNGLYVYAGTLGVLRTSTDAITWTARTSGATNNIDNLVYGNGIYVYSGNAGVLATSTDAITWTARISRAEGSISLAYGNGLYALNNYITSTDAITWKALLSDLSTNISEVLTYTDNTFIGWNGSTVASVDGIAWGAVSSPFGIIINAITAGNNLLVYGGNAGAIRTSPLYTYNIATDFKLPNFSDAQGINYYIKF
jgi:microcystin-dependent protein